MMDQVLIFFIGSILIVISLIMPLTFNLVKNLLEQTYCIFNRSINKKPTSQTKKDIGAIVLYYYFVSFFMEIFVLYGVFTIFLLMTILFERIQKCFVNLHILKCTWISIYLLILIFFIIYEGWRRKGGDKKNEHKCKCIMSLIVIAVPILLSIIFPIFLLCSRQSIILSFILFSLVPFYLLCWVFIGWIWTPVSRLVKLYSIENTSQSESISDSSQK